MDDLIYVTMTGAKESLVEQAVHVNNLANATTPGFKADLGQARSMPVFGDGHPTRVYAMAERPAVDLRPGPVVTTGRDLDVAVNGDGWLVVQAPDGSEALTRRGDLRISSSGLLETGAGHLVLGNGGPIAISPAQKLDIGADGTLSIVPLGGDPTTSVALDRLKLVNPSLDTLVKGEDGLIRPENGAPLDADASVRVIAGAIEASNVNAVESMVNMIEESRRFELQFKLLDVAERNDTASSSMLRLT